MPLPEKRIEVKQAFVLVERITIRHARDEIANLPGKAAAVIGEGILEDPGPGLLDAAEAVFRAAYPALATTGSATIAR